MHDPRNGLQRRYTMDEILELHGGRNRIVPISYDALRMLRDPLYVKMAQTLSHESSDQTARILAQIERVNAMRALASKTGVPMDQLEELTRRLQPPPSQTAMLSSTSLSRR